MNVFRHSETESANTVVCGWCGAEGQSPAQPCQQCQRVVANIPRWAQRIPGGRKWLSRRRLIRLFVAAVLLAFAAWLYFPFFPNPIQLLFKAPSTEVSSASTPGQWSMAGRDLQLTRHIPVAPVQPEGRVVWSRDLGTPTRGAPVVHDGIVYVGGYFKLIALESATGQVAWEYKTPSPLDHSVAIADDLLYVGLLNHRILALDRNTREVRWEFKTEGPIVASPVVDGGIVYVGSSDSFLYALDAATGKPLWQQEIQGELRSAPAVSYGRVFATDNLGNLYMFDARTGQSKLRFRTMGNTKASPVVSNEIAYFPAGGRVYAVDAQAREIPGEFQFKRVWSQFWVWRIPGMPRPPVQKGGRWRFDPEAQTSSGLVATPAVTSDSLYVGSFHGNFYGVDAHSGRETWRFAAEDAIFGSAVVLGDRVYFGSTDGFFYALRRSDGDLIWRLPLGAPIEISPVFADGRFYVRTSDGTLHAVE